ncbi:hypothetical protein QEZ54_18680, partial [Catellatospora sp. KI3]|uniref:hypothetical protein n=1 Tax=Catellatospora sp. KI3 TaxID=3041620 RepID=UPI0024832351
LGLGGRPSKIRVSGRNVARMPRFGPQATIIAFARREIAGCGQFAAREPAIAPQATVNVSVRRKLAGCGRFVVGVRPAVGPTRR